MDLGDGCDRAGGLVSTYSRRGGHISPILQQPADFLTLFPPIELRAAKKAAQTEIAMNIQLILDDIRFTRYRIACGTLSAALRSAMESRIASLERQLVVLKEFGASAESL